MNEFSKKKKVSSFIKKRIFFVFFCMVRNNICNTGIYILVLFLEFFQFAPLVLSNGLFSIDLGNLSLNKNYGGFLNFCLTVMGTLFDLQASMYVMAIFASTAFGIILIIAIIQFIICEFALRDKRISINSGIVGIYFKCSGFLIILINTILAPLLYGFCADIVHCVRIDGVLVFNAQRDIICFQPFHIGMIVLLVTVFILLLLLINFFDLLFTDSAPHSTIPWASPSTISITMWKQLFKLSFFVCALYDPTGTYYNLEFLFWILIQGIMINALLVNPPLLNHIVGCFNLIVQGTLFFFIVLMYIVRITVIEPEIFVQIIIFICSIIFGIVLFMIKTSIDNFYLNKDLMCIENEKVICYILYLYFDLIDKAKIGNQDAVFKLLGIYLLHQMTCGNSQCYCHSHFINTKEENNNEQIDDESIHLHHESNNMDNFQAYNEMDQNITIMERIQIVMNWIQESLNLHIIRNPRSFNLRLMNSFYSKEFSENPLKSINDLIFSEEILHSNMKNEFIIFRFKQVSQVSFSQQLRNHSTLCEIKEVIEFHTEKQRLNKCMQTTTNHIMSFWKLISKANVNFLKMFPLSELITRKNLKITQLFDNCLQLYNHDIKLIAMQRDFEKYVQNNEIIANNLENKIIHIQSDDKEQIKLGNYDDPIDKHNISNTAMVLVSSSPNQTGKIIKLNHEFELQLNYASKDLIGQNISVIMHEYMASKHDKMIEEYIKDGGRSLNIEKKNRLVRRGDDYCAMINLTVVLNPDFSQGMHFVCLFRKLFLGQNIFPEAIYESGNANWGFLVIDEEGLVKGISYTLSQKIRLPPSLVKPNSPFNLSIPITSLIEFNEDPILSPELEEKGIDTIISTYMIQENLSNEDLYQSGFQNFKKQAKSYKIWVIRKKMEVKMFSSKIYIFWILFQKYKQINLKEMEYNETHKILDQSEKKNEKFKESSEDYKCSLSQSVDSSSSSSYNQFQNRVQKFKESTDTEFSSSDLIILKRIMEVFIITCFIFTIVFLFLFIKYINNNESDISGLKLLYQRSIHLGNLFLSVNLLNSINKTENAPIMINNIDYFAFLIEFSKESNNKISEVQNIINRRKAQNENSFNLFEDTNVICFSISLNGNVHNFTIDLNRAVFQELTISQNILNNNFSLFHLNLDKIEVFIESFRLNWINSLSSISENNIIRFIEILQDSRWNWIYPNIFISVSIIISTIIIFLIIKIRVPKLLKKVTEVLMIFSDFSSKEINELLKNGELFLNAYFNLNFDFSDDYIRSREKNKSEISMIYKENQNLNKSKIIQKEENAQFERSNQNEEIKSQRSHNILQKNQSIKKEENDGVSVINENLDNSSSQLNEKENIKHRIIFNNNQKQSTKFTIFIIFCIIYFSSYYITFIITQIQEGFQETDSIDHINKNFNRNSNLIKSLIYGNDLYYNSSENSKSQIKYYLTEILKDNEYLGKIASSKIDLDKSITNKINLYDSENFCSTIKSDLNSVNISSTILIEIYNKIIDSCFTYSNLVCQKGMKFLHSYIYKQIYDLSIFDYDTLKYQWKSSNLLNSTSLYLFYLKISEEAIQLQILNTMMDHLTLLKNIISYFSLFYCGGILLIFFALNSAIFLKNEKQLLVAKGMLKIVPESYIAKIYHDKKYAELLKSLNF